MNPTSGTWTSSPKNISVNSSNATQIYYTIRTTTDGSTPADPPVPTSSVKDGSISGSSGTFQVYAGPRQHKKLKVRFRGYNSTGYGAATISFLYTIDLRGRNSKVPVPADYDGDRKSDLSLKLSNQDWLIDLALTGFGSWELGYSGYGGIDFRPVPKDYDGDKKSDLAVKGDNGNWLIDYASNGFGTWDISCLGYGGLDFYPVSADYDGDKKSDLAVKGDNGNWLIDYASNGFGSWDASYQGYGGADFWHVPADYDGDGKADLSVHGDNGNWLIDYASNGFGSWDASYQGY